MTALDTELTQLKRLTTVVADTGDIDEIARLQPSEATTNPSLILKAATQPKYAHFIEAARQIPGTPAERIDHVLVAFGCAILEHIPGRVSTEVDARLSFDTQATIEKARRLIALYESKGVDRSRVLIKIAATWEGCQAARVLEAEGIHCNMTLIFSLEQAIASSQAKATLISPFVGRIYDWYKAQAGATWDENANAGVNDPGVKSVTAIYTHLKRTGSATQIMGASFRNKGEILALAGCDLLTISPKLQDELNTSNTPVVAALSKDALTSMPDTPLTESMFRFALNESAVASDKLSAGIRAFVADTMRLEALLQ